MRIRAFLTHKLSEKYKDCQDSFEIGNKTKSIAIADGISQSIFPKVWADLLTKMYVTNREVSFSEQVALSDLKSNWKAEVEKVRSEKEKNNDPFLWILEDNIESGRTAGATFLGLRIDGINWTCEVIGDSCLVEISSKDEIKKIYCSKPEGEPFNNQPDYLDSSVSFPGKGEIKCFNGDFVETNTLLMVTDALSDLLYKKKLQHDFDIIEALLNLKNQQDFEKLINELRTKGMSNDDTTLIIIENDHNSELEVLFRTDLAMQILRESEEKLKSNSDDNSEKMFNVEIQPHSTLSKLPSPESVSTSKSKIESSIAANTSQTTLPIRNKKEDIETQIILLLNKLPSDMDRINMIYKIALEKIALNSSKVSSIRTDLRNIRSKLFKPRK